MKGKDSKIIIQLLVALLIIVVESATDIYTPSLPAIKKYFDSTEKMLQWTISINLIGISISSLFYGPLSDIIGRRSVILLGGFIFFIGSISCNFAQDLFSLIIFRFVQGIGGGVAIVVGFASIKDLFQGIECSKVLSRIGMVVAISPGLAPVVGSYIAGYLDWQFVFYFISILATLTFFINYLFFPETIKKKKKKVTFSVLVSGYLILFKNIRFWVFLVIQTLLFTRMFAETVNLPFVYIGGFSWLVIHYGYFMLVGSTFYVIGALINQKFVCKVGVEKMLYYGLVLAAITGAALLIFSMFFKVTPLIIEIIKAPGALALAFIFSNATTKVLDSAGKHSGTATALMGSFQMLIGSCGTYLIAKYYNGTYLPIAILYFICTFVSICLFCCITKKPFSNKKILKNLLME